MSLNHKLHDLTSALSIMTDTLAELEDIPQSSKDNLKINKAILKRLRNEIENDIISQRTQKLKPEPEKQRKRVMVHFDAGPGVEMEYSSSDDEEWEKMNRISK